MAASGGEGDTAGAASLDLVCILIVNSALTLGQPNMRQFLNINCK